MSGVCEWKLAPGKKATYQTACGKTIIASEAPEEDEECLSCEKPVKMVA
jgi:hypothetical protein